MKVHKRLLWNLAAQELNRETASKHINKPNPTCTKRTEVHKENPSEAATTSKGLQQEQVQNQVKSEAKPKEKNSG